jgi:hypothetical protein
MIEKKAWATMDTVVGDGIGAAFTKSFRATVERLRQLEMLLAGPLAKTDKNVLAGDDRSAILANPDHRR